MEPSYSFYLAIIIVIKLIFWSCICMFRYKRHQKLSEIRRTLATIEEQNMRAQAAGSGGQVREISMKEDKNIKFKKSQVWTTGTGAGIENRTYNETHQNDNPPSYGELYGVQNQALETNENTK